MQDERHPRFNSFVTSEGHAMQKGRKRMRGSDASEAQCAQVCACGKAFDKAFVVLSRIVIYKNSYG
jgi:hypothetical protein